MTSCQLSQMNLFFLFLITLFVSCSPRYFEPAVCGNGVCQIEEDCFNCPEDCSLLKNVPGCTPIIDGSNCGSSSSSGSSWSPRHQTYARESGRRSVFYSLFGPTSACSPDFDTVFAQIPYASQTKQNLLSARKAFGLQGAVILAASQPNQTESYAWIGFREPFCGVLSLKSNASVGGAADEFAIAIFIADAVDQVLDIGFVPPTCLKRFRWAQQGEFTSQFQRLGPASVIAAAPTNWILGVGQRTLAQQRKNPAAGSTGLKLRQLKPPDGRNPAQLLLDCRQNLDQCVLVGMPTNDFLLEQALYLLTFTFIAGMPLMAGPTSIFFAQLGANPGGGVGVGHEKDNWWPLLVGDTDRVGHWSYCRSARGTAKHGRRPLRPVEQVNWLLQVLARVGKFPVNLYRKLGSTNPLGRRSHGFGDRVHQLLLSGPAACVWNTRQCADQADFPLITHCLNEQARALYTLLASNKHNFTFF